MRLRDFLRARPTGLSAPGLLLPCRVLSRWSRWFGMVVGEGVVTLWTRYASTELVCIAEACVLPICINKQSKGLDHRGSLHRATVVFPAVYLVCIFTHGDGSRWQLA